MGLGWLCRCALFGWALCPANALSLAADSGAVQRIVYPSPESVNDQRPRYPVRVLELALQRAGLRFELAPSAATMQQARSLRALEHGLIDIAWSVSTPDREQRLRSVPIPIDRGLIGWRVLLVRRGDSARFSAVDGIEALRQFSAGQGHDWPDVRGLRSAGIPVVTAANYESLFQMLVRGRFDAFPRALSEIEAELQAHPDLPLEIEPRLLLHYQTGLYFLVHRDSLELAAAIERGLRESIADGSLQALFAEEYAQTLATLRLPERRVLSLPSDALVAQADAELPADWWFEPDRWP